VYALVGEMEEEKEGMMNSPRGRGDPLLPTSAFRPAERDYRGLWEITGCMYKHASIPPISSRACVPVWGGSSFVRHQRGAWRG
jgi:hypothetical protein